MSATLHYVEREHGYTVHKGRQENLLRLINGREPTVADQQDRAKVILLVEENHVAESAVLVCIDGGRV